MATPETISSSAAENPGYTVAPLQPEIATHLLSPKYNSNTRKRESFFTRATRHRFALKPVGLNGAGALHTKEGESETTYVYRTNRRGEAHLLPDCRFNKEEGVYPVPTRRVLSFLTGEWNAVTFTDTEVKAPEMLHIPLRAPKTVWQQSRSASTT